MTWQLVASIQLTKDWQLTEPIIGSVFRLKHMVNTSRAQDLRAVIAQAYDENALLTCFNDKVVTLRNESQGFIFPQIAGILNRKFGLKRLDDLTDSWTITIEVLDGMPESILLPIALSEVEGLQGELNNKEALGTAASAIASHKTEIDPHSQYATDSQISQLQSAIDNKVANNDIRLSNPRIPTGTAGGVLSGTYPNPGFKASVFAASLDINGWRKLPSGDIEQWGIARLTSANGVDYNGSVLFPLSFPNNSFVINLNIIAGDADPRLFGQIIPTLANNGCIFGSRNNINTVGTYIDVYYRVIGV